MSEPILATDAERDTALAQPRDASVDGRLTVEDLAERAELVHTARTREDLAVATAGLERAPAPPTGDVDRQRRLAVGAQPAALTEEINAQIRRYQ